ncbi:MAG: hypothetical protein QOJ63_1882 [Solirubrobacteraceae bacterium]|nr:hypothetical protein [Solirubrobacteraceae bacterium]
MHDAIEVRVQLWADVDTAGALLTTIETAAKPAAGTVTGTVDSHLRLTSGRDLLAELRAVEVEIRNEVQAISERESKISAHEAEIARLNRNRTMLILVAVATIVLVIIVIVSSAG